MMISNNMKEASCIILFLRAPEFGKVKTRLAEHIDPEFILLLYQGFVKDMIETIRKMGKHIILSFYPESAEKEMIAWLGDEFCFVPQHGSDLGERMANAFNDAFKAGFKKAILIGTDIPDLPGSIIGSSFQHLDNYPIVLGPTYDRGYYLVGFNNDSFDTRVFKHIAWGTDVVYQQTVAYLQTKQSPFYELPKWHDIDVYQDLVDFIHRNQYQQDRVSHTFAILNRTKFNHLLSN
jgi:uncharacterized protein